MKHYKRILACLLSVALIVGIFPTTAFAHSSVDSNQATEDAAEGKADPNSEPYALLELREKRDRNTKCFLMSDGSTMVATYPVPVHFLDENHEWQDYDNTLSETAAIAEDNPYCNTDYVNKESDMAVRLSKKTNGKKFVRLEIGGYKISWYYRGARKVTGIVSETEYDDDLQSLEDIASEVKYPGVFDGVDLQYFVGTNQVKENLILNHKDVQNQFVAEYKCNGLTAVLVNEHTVEFRNSSDKAVYTLEAPYLMDANGEVSSGVALEIVSQKNHSVLIKTVCDENWLLDSSRVFPVTVDPAVNIDGVTGYWESAYVASAWPTTACGSNSGTNKNFLYVGYDEQRGQTRTLIKPGDLPDIGRGGKVIDARISLYLGQSDSSIRVNVHKVTSDWNKETVVWNDNVQYESKISDYLIADSVSPEWTDEERRRTIEITEIVDSWYNVPATYKGILLRSDSENSTNAGVQPARAWFCASTAYWGAAAWPMFTLTYRNMSGLESYWSYSQFDVGKNGSLYVNNYNGNATYVQQLTYDCGGELMPLNINAVYNTNGADFMPYSSIGKHMQTNFHMFVQYDRERAGDGFRYYLNDADGTKHWFYFNDSNATTGMDEDGLGLTLTTRTLNNPKSLSHIGYVIEDKAHNKMMFNDYGYLLAVQNEADVNNNIQYETVDGVIRIRCINDGAGRSYSFSYSSDFPNRISSITDPAGRITWLYYENDYLTRFEFIDEQSYEIHYDTSSDVITSLPGFNNDSTISLSYHYNNQKRVSTVGTYVDDDLRSIYIFDYLQNASYIQDTLGNFYEYQFNDQGQTTGIINFLDHTGQYYSYENIPKENKTDIRKNKLTSKSGILYSASNYLYNPGFTRAISQGYWIRNETGVSSADPVRVNSLRHTTDYAVKVEKPQNSHVSHLVQDVGTLDAGWYTLSGYVNTAGETLGGDGLVLSCEIWSSDLSSKNRTFNIEETTLTDGWERRQTTFYVNSGEHIRVVCGFSENGWGTAYFDDLQLEKSDSGANSFNLVENSNFQYGNSLWTSVDEALTFGVDQTIGAIRYAKMSSAGNPANIDLQSAHQDLYVSGHEGDVYSFGGWVRADSVAIDNGTKPNDSLPCFDIRLYYYDASGNMSEENIAVKANPDADGYWQLIAAKAIIPADYTRLRIEVNYNHNPNDCRFSNLFCYAEEFGQTFVYDANGNVVNAKDKSETESSFAYYGDRMAKMLNPTGSRFTYTYNDANSQQLDYALSSSGQRYSFDYDERGNLIGTTVSAQPAATELQTNKEYYIINAYSGQALDCGLPSSNHRLTTYRWDPAAIYQKWTLHAVDASNEIFEIIASGGADNRIYLDVLDGSSESGAEMQTYLHNGSSAQRFRIEHATDNMFYIRTGTTNYEKMLDAKHKNAKDIVVSEVVCQSELSANDGFTEGKKWYFYEVSPSENSVITSSATYTNDYNFVSSSTDSLGNTEQYAYSSTTGVVGTVTAPNGVQTHYEYTDADSKMSAVYVTANGHYKGGVGYQYDGELLNHITTANNQVYSFQYNGLGQKTSVRVGSGANSQELAQYVYTDFGSQLERLNYGNGQYVCFWYDSYGRETNRTYNSTNRNSSDKQTFYTPQGNIGLILDSLESARTQYTYDLSGRLVQVRKNFGSEYGLGSLIGQLSYRYENGTGRLLSRTLKLPSLKRVTDYTYGVAVLGENPDAIYSVRQNDDIHLEYAYDALGRRTSSTLAVPNKTTSYTYVNRLFTNNTSTRIASLTSDDTTWYYTYDANGNITDVTDEEGVELEYYEYDALGQLTMAYKNGAVYEYAYDAGGNLLYQMLNGVIVKTYAYTDPVWKDRLTSFNEETITYDAIGNPTQYRDGLQFFWDYGRRMTGWQKSNGDFGGYGLNADGERFCKATVDKYIEYIIVDGVTVGEKCDDYTMYYLFDENGDIYGITYNGANYFFRKNLQGDVIGIWNSAGTEIVTYTYDPWGEVLSVNDNSGINLGTINPFRYRTYYYDVETGLYYLNSRYYDPETGRFINADGQLNSGILGNNMFAYCENNPVNYFDPYGEVAVEIGALVASLESVCTGIAAAGSMNIANPVGWALLGLAGICGIAWLGVAVYNAIAEYIDDQTFAAQAILDYASTTATPPPPNKGGKGTQVTSKSLYKKLGKNGYRIDVENPGNRVGQIHLQKDGVKYYYSVSEKAFRINSSTGELAPKAIQQLLQDPKVIRAIGKGLRILGY